MEQKKTKNQGTPQNLPGFDRVDSFLSPKSAKFSSKEQKNDRQSGGNSYKGGARPAAEKNKNPQTKGSGKPAAAAQKRQEPQKKNAQKNAPRADVTAKKEAAKPQANKQKNNKKAPPVREKAAPVNEKRDFSAKNAKGGKNFSAPKAETVALPKYDGKDLFEDRRNERQKQKNKGKSAAPKARGKLRVLSLGGLGEIGKNMTVIEYNDDIVVVDVGVAFPDEDMFGIDLVIPDVSYLVKNASRVRGFLITHGHEDHIGAVAYILAQVNAPVYGTALSLGIIRGKLEENPPKQKPDLRTVSAGDAVKLGEITAEFIHVNHSIADACAIALHTPLGVVYHSGDFKLDVSPIDGQIMDLVRIGELGKEGVTLLLCESTNAERQGFTPSERMVGSSLERIFSQYEDNRLIVATFSSNIHRVQQIINASAKHGRKVAVIGRSMVNVIDAAVKLGYMDLPEGVLVDIGEIKRYPQNQITLITTGSQGEPMSALYRIAFSEHDKVKLTAGDVVVLSSSTIPGNEKLIGNIINTLVRSGVKVVNDSVEAVHVSGHACREELKLLMALLKPRYFMPIHGEYRHLYANKEIAEFMGISPDRIFLSDIGRVLEIDADGAKFAGSVPSGSVFVDGSGVGDIGAVVLRDRKSLAEEGVVAVVASVALREGMLLSGPDIVSRGFVYVKESEELMDETRKVALDSLKSQLDRRETDFAILKATVRDDVAKFIYKKTKRKPMILPILMDI